VKCTKFELGWSSAPDPAGGSLQRSPGPLARFKGPTSKGRKGKKDGREGRGCGRREGNLLLRRGEVEGREERTVEG